MPEHYIDAISILAVATGSFCLLGLFAFVIKGQGLECYYYRKVIKPQEDAKRRKQPLPEVDHTARIDPGPRRALRRILLYPFVKGERHELD